jgi:hypothetical protein
MKPKAKMPPRKPKKRSNTGKLFACEKIGPQHVVDAAHQQQTPSSNEDAPADLALKEQSEGGGPPNQRRSVGHEGRKECEEAEQ